MYTTKERLIYGPYNNGVKYIYGDPIRIYRRLVVACGGDLDAVGKAQAQNDDQLAKANAVDKLIHAAQQAFGLVLFNPEAYNPGEKTPGLNDDEVLTLLDDFFGWCKKKEGITENSQTLPQPTASVNPLRIPTSSASGSTFQDKTPDPRGRLRSVLTSQAGRSPQTTS